MGHKDCIDLKKQVREIYKIATGLILYSIMNNFEYVILFLVINIFPVNWHD